MEFRTCLIFPCSTPIDKFANMDPTFLFLEKISYYRVFHPVLDECCKHMMYFIFHNTSIYLAHNSIAYGYLIPCKKRHITELLVFIVISSGRFQQHAAVFRQRVSQWSFHFVYHSKIKQGRITSQVR